jgi:hypothetical protein
MSLLDTQRFYDKLCMCPAMTNTGKRKELCQWRGELQISGEMILEELIVCADTNGHDRPFPVKLCGFCDPGNLFDPNIAPQIFWFGCQ